MKSCRLSLAAVSLVFVVLDPAYGFFSSLTPNNHRRCTWTSLRISEPRDDVDSNSGGIRKVDASSSIEPKQSTNSTQRQSLTPRRQLIKKELSSVGRGLGTRIANRCPNWLTQKRLPHGLSLLLFIAALRTHCACSGGMRPPSLTDSSSSSESTPAGRLDRANPAGDTRRGAEVDAPKTLVVERQALRLPSLPHLPASLTKAVVNVSSCIHEALYFTTKWRNSLNAADVFKFLKCCGGCRLTCTRRPLAKSWISLNS
jgi:hypothetical protein